MPDLNIFVSFEFDKDKDLKGNFYAQAKTNTPYRIRNCSLKEAYPSQYWQNKARDAIKACDIVIVLVGQDTHNAPGVVTEIRIARRLGKPILQVAPQGRHYQGLAILDPPIRWKWPRINRQIRQLCAVR